jgi:hypothetical protein
MLRSKRLKFASVLGFQQLMKVERKENLIIVLSFFHDFQLAIFKP